MILSAVCPNGWTQKSEFSKCYYYLNDEMRNWKTANEKCRALDPDGEATLTSVQSQEENDYVKAFGGNEFDASVWIGGTDKAEEGTWR